MKIRYIFLASTCAAALAMGGCASNPSNAQVGTGVGAVVGGAAGNAIFGGPVGTIGGAAAGALIGHEVGEDRDQRDQRRPYRR
jgi:osmotically inducible lipoprotein OsmB